MKKIEMAKIKLTEREIDAAIRVLRSGALRQGKECDAFEKEFANRTGAKFAVTSASGSAAIHLAFLAFLQPGDEVLVPSFTFIATASMVSMSGGTPIFCDVEPETFLINLEDAEKKITSKTRAIIPVHLFGNPCDPKRINSFANKHNLTIVWDAAQAHGASASGFDVGAWNDMTCYSFYPSKNMFVGEGGITCTNNEELANKIKFLRSHGQTGKYYHSIMGLNYRMTDLEAAIGREQLHRLEKILTIRRRNAAVYNEAFSKIDGLRLQKITEGGEHAWHQYCMVIDKSCIGFTRDVLSERLTEKGVATSVHYPRGLHQQPIYKESYEDVSLPITEYLSQNIIAIPVHHELNEEDVRYVANAVVDSISAGNDR